MNKPIIIIKKLIEDGESITWKSCNKNGFGKITPELKSWMSRIDTVLANTVKPIAEPIFISKKLIK